MTAADQFVSCSVCESIATGLMNLRTVISFYLKYFFCAEYFSSYRNEGHHLSREQGDRNIRIIILRISFCSKQ